MSITRERLMQVLEYDSSTGIFHWLKSGKVAGTLLASGYIQINVDGKFHRAHRLAFLYVHGHVPEFLDHINRVRNDNRISNLRPATKGENRQNASMSTSNTSGRIGVSWCKRTGKWQAQIKVDKSPYHLGRYDSIDDAESAYLEAKRKLHKFAPSLSGLAHA